MNTVFKKFLISFAFIAAIFTPVFSATPTYAAECRYFLGLNSWDCGVVDTTSEEDLKANIVAIASNVLLDLTVIISYLIIGYVIYGGYLYMFSEGDPAKAAAGKKTILHAFIGLGIAMSASVIVGAIRIALIGGNSALTADAVDANVLVTNLIQWVIGIAGLVAAVFLIIGGISYITSSGDAGKLQKAKNTILYALIGLIVVAIAEVATAFVSNLIRNANQTTEPTSVINTTIAKELNEK